MMFFFSFEWHLLEWFKCIFRKKHIIVKVKRKTLASNILGVTIKSQRPLHTLYVCSWTCESFFTFTVTCSTDGGFQKVRLLWNGVLKKRVKTNSGRRGVLHVHLVTKTAWFLKQQTEFFMISFVVDFKNFAILNLVQHIKVFFIKKA